MNNLVNLGNTIKSTILRNKSKPISLALILILAFSTAVAMMPYVMAASTINGQTPQPAGAVYTPAPSGSQPGVIFPWSTGGSNMVVAPTPAEIATYNYPEVPMDIVFTVAPNPTGVGQTESIIFGAWNGPPTVNPMVGIAGAGNYGGWGGNYLTITAPNGSQTVIGPVLSSDAGSSTYTFQPDAAGVWTANYTFVGEIANTTSPAFHVYWAPYTATQNFTVQTAPIPGFVEKVIPAENQPFTLPVDTQNRAWYLIDGPWLIEGYNLTGKFNPYTNAPLSPHILWNWQIGPLLGGNIGGQYGALSWHWFDNHSGGLTLSEFPRTAMGFSYPCVMSGYLFGDGIMSEPPVYNYSYMECINLKTGAIVWKVPGSEDASQILAFSSPNDKVMCDILWYIGVGTQDYRAYDADTGNTLFSISGVPVALSAGDGDIVAVWNGPVNESANSNNGFLMGGDLQTIQAGTTANGYDTWYCVWSVDQLWIISGETDSEFQIPGYAHSANGFFITAPSVIPWVDGVLWNVTSIMYPGATSFVTGTCANGDPAIIASKTGGASMAQVPGQPTGYISPWTNHWYELDMTNGKLMWNTTFTVPPFSDASLTGSVSPNPGENGVFTAWYPDNGTLCGFSMFTGAEIWHTQVAHNSYGDETIGHQAPLGIMMVDGYGCIYIMPLDGWMNCVNASTGVIIWSSHTAAGGLQMPEPYYPNMITDESNSQPSLAGGLVFTTTGREHGIEPDYQGHLLYAWNATTGAQVWNLSGQIGIYAIADGVIAGVNMYEGTLMGISPGPSQTTVTAPQTPLTAGSPVVIEGTVTDQSPALMGTPCISDAAMGGWMGYELMDQPYPSNAAGVTVQLTAIDPNGNFISIGNVTSNTLGFYSYTWTPPTIPGTYTITATMPATNSYYTSSADCAATVVDPGTQPNAMVGPAAPTATPTSVANLYFVPAIAGLFVLIIVVAIVLALLMLRKRP